MAMLEVVLGVVMPGSQQLNDRGSDLQQMELAEELGT